MLSQDDLDRAQAAFDAVKKAYGLLENEETRSVWLLSLTNWSKFLGCRDRQLKVAWGVLIIKILGLPSRCVSSRLVANKHFIEFMAPQSSISIKKV